jgi:hypothetical protein
MHALLPLLLLGVFALPSSSYFISHSFAFPSIPFSAGVYHIHSPLHFMEAHGFTLPGFKIIETSTPQSMGDYIVAEFFYSTHFTGRMSARVFSSTSHTSHIVLMDPDRVPCLLGKLTLERCSTHGHRVCARADLLRPATVWERMVGGQRLVKEADVERSIKLGYSNFKNDLNLARYVNMVLNEKRDDSI